MIKRIYSILDIKAEIYGPLFDMANDSTAIRFFENLVNDTSSSGSSSAIALYPNDFALYEICRFDDSTGFVDNSVAFPRHIMDGRSLKRQLSTSAQPERQSEPLMAVNPVDNSVDMEV